MEDADLTRYPVADLGGGRKQDDRTADDTAALDDCPHTLPLKRGDIKSDRVAFANSQTTAIWVRGILASDYGVDIERLRWFTQEDAHVAEYREPPGVERVAADKNLLKMLREGELDAAIHGADLPKDPSLMSVIPAAPK